MEFQSQNFNSLKNVYLCKNLLQFDCMASEKSILFSMSSMEVEADGRI
jgi:hypothetical protein